MNNSLDAITNIDFIPHKCVAIKKNKEIIVVRTIANKEEQGIMLKNIKAINGKYMVEIISETNECRLYWYGTYNGYQRIPLLQKNNVFQIKIQNQDDPFDIGILTDHSVSGKKIISICLKITKSNPTIEFSKILDLSCFLSPFLESGMHSYEEANQSDVPTQEEDKPCLRLPAGAGLTVTNQKNISCEDLLFSSIDQMIAMKNESTPLEIKNINNPLSETVSNLPFEATTSDRHPEIINSPAEIISGSSLQSITGPSFEATNNPPSRLFTKVIPKVKIITIPTESSTLNKD